MGSRRTKTDQKFLQGKTEIIMKIQMTITAQLERGMCLTDDEERMWAENEVFIGDGNFILYSNEVGDSVAVVKEVKNLKWIKD